MIIVIEELLSLGISNLLSNHIGHDFRNSLQRIILNGLSRYKEFAWDGVTLLLLKALSALFNEASENKRLETELMNAANEADLKDLLIQLK